MSIERRALPGYEGIYEVSSEGRVYSVSRPAAGKPGVTKILKERLITPYHLASGHPVVYLFNDKVRTTHRIADLVLLAFVGQAPAGMRAVHKDEDVANNALTNLKYGPPVEYRNPGSSKLVEKLVREILVSTEPVAELAKRYKVGKGTIRAIKNRTTWKHVE